MASNAWYLMVQVSYMAGTCGRDPIDVWYLWYKVGVCGTKLVHVVQGQLMSHIWGTGQVHVL